MRLEHTPVHQGAGISDLSPALFLAVFLWSRLLWKIGTNKHVWKGKGTSFVTNQRVVFVREPPSFVEGKVHADLSAPLVTLTVPLDNYMDTRYMIPIFGAPYFEATILPVPQGGLPAHDDPATPGAAPTGTLTTYFNEGGGIDFRNAVEEVKARFDEMRGHDRPTHFESLPQYSPQASVGGRSSHPVAASSSAGLGALAADGRPAPSREDVATAAVVHEAEGHERAASACPRDAPPTYEPPPYTD